MFIFIVLLLLKNLFTHGPIDYEKSLNKSIWPVDGTLTGTTTLGQIEPGNEGVLRLLDNINDDRKIIQKSLMMISILKLRKNEDITVIFLSGTTTPCQNEPGNEGVLHSSQSSITEVSPSSDLSHCVCN